MFSLLSPVSLWLGALLAVPLVIHFLGRQRLRKEPFPSLLLLEEKFARSMQRHRLKNLLLLLIRTLLVLALLLALANPALESKQAAGAGSSESAAALIHNGAWGLLPSPDGDPAAARDHATLEVQRRRIRSLDSAAGAPVKSLLLLPDGPGRNEAAARFGTYRDAVERLLAALDPAAPTAVAYLPAFAWEDLAPARDDLLRALKDRPGLQIVFWDHGAEGARLSAFSGVRALPSTRTPTVTLRALLSPEAAESGAKVRAWIGERAFQEASAEESLAEIELPLSEGARTAGRLSAEGAEAGGFAVRDWHYCFPNPGRLVLAHAGSALASLPSLGRENYFRRIVHVATARDLPIDGSLRLVHLSNERNTDAAAYGRIVEFVKRGGRLIIGVGRDSDIPLINRFLLQPLRLGRLGVATEVAQGGRAEADPKALAAFGGLPANAGTLGQVRKRFAFVPDSGTAVLIRQGGEPVLAERDFQQGRVLLWTTDLDDLEWTDLGVAPLVPLLHQAFQEGAGAMTRNLAVDSDSLMVLDLPEPGLRVEVRDPDGRPFTRLRAEGGRLRIGPFDKLGLHRVAFGSDSAAFAVNLASRGPAPAQAAGDWERWNRDSREAFLAAFEPFRDRVTVVSPDGGGAVRAAVRPLWKWFFLAAILLLFAEGLIVAAYSPGTGSRGRQA